MIIVEMYRMNSLRQCICSQQLSPVLICILHACPKGAAPRMEFVSIPNPKRENFCFQSNLGNGVMAHKISAVLGSPQNAIFGLGFLFSPSWNIRLFEAAMCFYRVTRVVAD